MGVTPPSAWPWLDHSVSVLLPATHRPIQTRFRCAYTYRLKLAANRNSLTHYTKGTPSPHKRLRLLVGIRFQVSFTPLVGVLFTFPSRYLFTIGHQGVFRLGGWSPHLQTGFHVSRLTQGLSHRFYIRGYHPLWPDFPDRSADFGITTGLLRVRSPLLTESQLMSFPAGTEMFQFPAFASRTYVFSSGYPSQGGLPHSDIHGSTPARGSPWLFAACHVLHRLLVPRHPPNALLTLKPYRNRTKVPPRSHHAQKSAPAA